MNLALVIPTYNEAGNIRDIIQSVRTLLSEVRIIIVDDSSPDGTADIVTTVAQLDPLVTLWSREKKEGLGKAYQFAFLKLLSDSEVDVIGMMDADFSHDPSYLIDMCTALQDADVVIGSRYCKGGATEGWEYWRVVLSRWGNRYSSWVTGIPVRDTTAGFCLFRATSLARVYVETLSSAGYAFQMELKHRLWKQGARIIEIPITFRNRREGESKISRHIISEGLIAPWKMRFSKNL
jgi:dolichol-phosphate mannosyltransferase